jgi:hypothetical protein
MYPFKKLSELQVTQTQVDPLRYVEMNPSTEKDKEKILKAAREKQLVLYGDLHEMVSSISWQKSWQPVPRIGWIDLKG